MVQKEFPAADKNKDGYLCREEVVAFYGSKEGKPN
jgi:Ca2+-binding EF-hand superfamily protein